MRSARAEILIGPPRWALACLRCLPRGRSLAWGGPALLSWPRLAAGAIGFHFGGAQLRREAVEHRVHVLVAIGAAEFLGQLDALVEHHAPGHVGAVLEFVGAD